LKLFHFTFEAFSTSLLQTSINCFSFCPPHNDEKRENFCSANIVLSSQIQYQPALNKNWPHKQKKIETSLPN
jgi:hypothetical protein